jgi:acetoin utilization deacetylase AcuC-like enzyme
VQVVAEWSRLFGNKLNIKSFNPVTLEQIAKAHSTTYVDGIFAGTVANGFGSKDLAVAESLRYTSGSMLAAATASLTEGVAASPTSGFHHACFAHGGGFCTFNGLVITALDLYDEGKVDKVGIIDCDYHYGNGTDDIIDHLGLNFITHYTAGESFNSTSSASRFLATLPNKLLKFKTCDVLLYQAGADPYVDDPLGGFLTESQLAERDYIVFSFAKKFEIPIAFNLAGGYTPDFQKVLDIHNNTMKQCLKVYNL